MSTHHADLEEKSDIKPHVLHSIPKDKILAMTKLKSFAKDKLHVSKTMIYFFDRVENIVEKDRNHHFSNIRFVVCKSFQFSQGHNFVVW